MSALRDIRLIVARHLDLPPNLRAGVLDVMNQLDASLDEEGWQEPQAVADALRRLDRIIVSDTDEEIEDEFAGEDDLTSLDEMLALPMYDKDEDDDDQN